MLAANSMTSRPRLISSCASPRVLPFSSEMIPERVSMSPSIFALKAKSVCIRSLIGVRAQALKASSAFKTVLSIAAASATFTCCRRDPSRGLTTSKVWLSVSGVLVFGASVFIVNFDGLYSKFAILRYEH